MIRHGPAQCNSRAVRACGKYERYECGLQIEKALIAISAMLGLPATGYRLPATSYQLPATSYQLPPTT